MKSWGFISWWSIPHWESQTGLNPNPLFFLDVLRAYAWIHEQVSLLAGSGTLRDSVFENQGASEWRYFERLIKPRSNSDYQAGFCGTKPPPPPPSSHSNNFRFHPRSSWIPKILWKSPRILEALDQQPRARIQQIIYHAAWSKTSVGSTRQWEAMNSLHAHAALSIGV